MRAERRIPASCFVLLAWMGILAGPAWACNVPVFRYALERWEPDAYEVVIFRRGAFSADEAAAAARLRARGGDRTSPANCVVQTVDPDEGMDEELTKLWKAQRGAALPWVVLRYPERYRAGLPQTVWAGRLSTAATKALVDSPVRREVAKRILAGDSAVWILLECGDRAKDAAPAKLLKDELKKAEKVVTLRAPGAEFVGAADELPADELPADELPADEGSADEGPADEGAPETPQRKLRIRFSLLRLSRTDPAEKVLVNMLLRSEPGLETKYASQPMAFAVFGRGRLLWTLVGAGICADNIHETCEFVAGPCSCLIKEQHPGLDLLVSRDWDAALDSSMVEEATPPLVGLPEAAALGRDSPPVAAPARPGAVGPAATPAPAAGHLLRNVLLAVGFVVAAVAAAALALTRRQPRS